MRSPQGLTGLAETVYVFDSITEPADSAPVSGFFQKADRPDAVGLLLQQNCGSGRRFSGSCVSPCAQDPETVRRKDAMTAPVRMAGAAVCISDTFGSNICPYHRSAVLFRSTRRAAAGFGNPLRFTSALRTVTVAEAIHPEYSPVRKVSADNSKNIHSTAHCSAA